MADKHETEEQLITRAQGALSHCNWELGECAAKWTRKYARGRTDADFGALIGLSGDQVYQRRRVWETFSDVSGSYPKLKWSHFYAALTWDDAAECLQWAADIEATVAEMKAWRRAQHGEDLSEAPESGEWDQAPGAASLELLPVEAGLVRDPATFGSGSARRGGTGGRERDVPTVAGAAREAGDDYAPFGKGARGRAGEGETAIAGREAPSAEHVLKRIITALERCDAALTPSVLEQFPSAPVKQRRRLLAAIEGLNSKAAGLRV